MDFHSMIGKLRAIESLGVTKNYVAEEEATTEGSTCTMTAEGESCPVHGLNECPMVPMEEGDIDTLKGMLKNSGQMSEQDAMGFGNEWNDGASSIPADKPSPSDSGETWAAWFNRIYGGGQTVATGGEIQGADTSGGVSGNPMGDFTGDPNSTPTSVKPVVEPTPKPAPKPASGAVAGGDTRMGAASTGAKPAPKAASSAASGAVAGGDTRMGAASTGATPATSTAAPQSYDDLSFGKAFAAARKAAGGNGGVFMWKGKPYQTTIKGEKGLAWNSPQLKRVGGGWETNESINEGDPMGFGNEWADDEYSSQGTEPETSVAQPATPFPARAAGLSTPPLSTRPKTVPGAIAGGDTRMGAASTGILPPDTSGGVTRDPSYRPKTAAPSSTAGGARPEGPASGMPAAPKTAAPQSYDDLSFGKAFAAARKAAGGNGGVFMWRGKPYQTTIKGEKGLAWNSPKLKRVGGGWETNESINEADPMGFGNEWLDRIDVPAATSPTEVGKRVLRAANNIRARNAKPKTGLEDPSVLPRSIGGTYGVPGAVPKSNTGRESPAVLPKSLDGRYGVPGATAATAATGAAPAGYKYIDTPAGKKLVSANAATPAATDSYAARVAKTKATMDAMAAERGNAPLGYSYVDTPAGKKLVANKPGQTGATPATAAGTGAVAGGDARMGAASTGARAAGTGTVAGGDTRMPAASTGAAAGTGAVAGGDTRMGAASTGKLPGVPANIGKPTGLSVEYNDEEWYQFVGSDGRTRYVGSDSGVADKATRARIRGIMKADPVQYNQNNSEEAQLALASIAQGVMGESVDRIMELAGLKNDDDIQDMEDTAKVDDMSTDMSIDDLMRKYGVSDEVSEDAPLVGAPFTPLGATNNGPEEWGMVVTGGTNVNHFEESVTVNSNMDVRDGKVTKSLSISATDEDVDRLAAMLRNAGIGDQISVKRIDICDGCGRPVEDCACDHHDGDCGCGAPNGECQCDMALENADHDYGNHENSSEGNPLDAEEYIWNGPHVNQRFGKIGDNTLMAERAISLFKNYSKEYSQVLAEADLEPSNAGFDSPLTANNRDEFDKDPFVDETPVDDGSRSPLSTIKRQDVMN